MEREARRALGARIEANKRLARHKNVSIRTGWTHTSNGEIFLRDGQGQKRKRT